MNFESFKKIKMSLKFAIFIYCLLPVFLPVIGFFGYLFVSRLIRIIKNKKKQNDVPFCIISAIIMLIFIAIAIYLCVDGLVPQAPQSI